eukprot:m.3094 g.3094  ORF g.3094 m.3094 type:complete len:127 (-) comp2544_c0_seq1:192-572(-)
MDVFHQSTVHSKFLCPHSCSPTHQDPGTSMGLPSPRVHGASLTMPNHIGVTLDTLYQCVRLLGPDRMAKLLVHVSPHLWPLTTPMNHMRFTAQATCTHSNRVPMMKSILFSSPKKKDNNKTSLYKA